MKDEQIIETTNAEGKRVRIIRRVVRRPNNVENNQISTENDIQNDKKDEISDLKIHQDSLKDLDNEKEVKKDNLAVNLNQNDYKIEVNDDLNTQIMIKKIINVSSNFMCIVVNNIIFMINETGAKMLGDLSGDDYSGRSFLSLIKDKGIFKNIDKIIFDEKEIKTKLVKQDKSEIDCILRVNYFKVNDNNSYVIEAREVIKGNK